MSYNSLTIPVTVLFFINGFLHLLISFALKKKFPNEHNLITSVATFILWVAAGLLYPLLYPDLLIEQTISTILIVFITPLMVIFVLSFNYRKGVKSIDGFNNFLNEFIKSKSGSSVTSWDFKRKMFHLIPSFLIILLASLSVDYMPLILTVGYSGVIVFQALDYVRLSFIYGERSVVHLLPGSVSRLLIKVMKERELYEPLKVVPLVLGMVPSLLLPFSIFCSVSLVSTVSDGFASVFGHAFGKKNLLRVKTLPGYFAGGVSAFVLIMLSCSFLNPGWGLFNILILSIAGASSFFIIDFVNARIDDNVLNPLIIGLVLGITYLLIF